VARRYVAGESLDGAVATVGALHREGFHTTVALLGEEVHERDHAQLAVAEYGRAIEALPDDGRAGISVKLTLLGLGIDRDFCRDNLLAVAEQARRRGLFVRIDMEDHTTTDANLALYREAQERCGNLGIVLQAYLRRTLEDIAGLPVGTRVRLCKGIYLEPERIAFRDDDAIRRHFVLALERLFERGCAVAVASHDRSLIDQAREMIERRGLDPSQVEFQTLLGVTEGLRDELLREGRRVRVYVPYGSEWYAYSIRRLRENPKIAVHVLRAFLGMRSSR
jgi:proline dehydrogenase